MADASFLKDMKIKTGVVKRTQKERDCYAKEVVKCLEKVEKLKTDGSDEYTIKKANEVVQDTRQMVPDCTRRLQRAVDDLQSVMDGANDEAKETDEYKAANEQVQSARTALSN